MSDRNIPNEKVIVRDDGVRFLVLPGGMLVEEGVEHFNNVGPFPLCDDIAIERDAENYPDHVGKLWTGSTWLSVGEARALRNWLTEALPALEQLK